MAVQSEESSGGSVLLMRNLPRGSSEHDVATLVLPFTDGVRPKVFLQAPAGHAFIEFPNGPEGVQSALRHFAQSPLKMHGSEVQVLLSRRSSVRVAQEESGFRVLLCTVSRVEVPVELHVVHMLFSQFGCVEKVVIFMRNPSVVQVFVQFTAPEQARQAMIHLHNENMYDGCNTMQIQRSHNDDLQVNMSDRQWDYMAHPQGPGRATSVPMVESVSSVIQAMLSSGSAVPPRLRDVDLEALNANGTPVVMVHGLKPGLNARAIFNLFSLYGVVLRVKVLRDRPDKALVQYNDPGFAAVAVLHLHEVAVLHERPLQVCFSRNFEVAVTSMEANTSTYDLNDQRFLPHETARFIKSASQPTDALFLSNIADSMSKQALAQLVGHEDLVVNVGTYRSSYAASKGDGKETNSARFFRFGG